MRVRGEMRFYERFKRIFFRVLTSLFNNNPVRIRCGNKHTDFIGLVGVCKDRHRVGPFCDKLN